MITELPLLAEPTQKRLFFVRHAQAEHKYVLSTIGATRRGGPV